MWKEFIDGYSVSDSGEVRNDKNGELRKPQKRRKNADYLSVCIKGKNFDIHRLVAEKFVSNSDSLPEVRHLDGNAKNNHVSNLAWGTHRQNIKDAMDHGTHTSLTNQGYKNQKNEAGKPSKVGRKARSGVPGVQVHEGARGTTYRVFLNSGGSRYLGSYKTIEEAEFVHRKAYFELYGVYP